MALDQYYLLGRSGLRVSRLALGTMNFGIDGFHAAYGKTEERGRAHLPSLPRSAAATSSTPRTSTPRGRARPSSASSSPRPEVRDRLVLTTQVHQQRRPGDPNAGGNGRKHMIRALEASLRRLAPTTSTCSCCTPGTGSPRSRRSLRTFDDLVRAGKIRYAGLSDVPSWYAARAQTYAEAHSLPPMINLQLPYSLVERQIEAGARPDGAEPGPRHHRVESARRWLPQRQVPATPTGLTGDGRLERPWRVGALR